MSDLAKRIEELEAEGRRSGGWVAKACCPCGETFRAWKGDLFFVSENCCPKCGRSKSEFSIRTVRWVFPLRGPWWKGWPMIAAGYWQSHSSKGE